MEDDIFASLLDDENLGSFAGFSAGEGEGEEEAYSPPVTRMQDIAQSQQHFNVTFTPERYMSPVATFRAEAEMRPPSTTGAAFSPMGSFSPLAGFSPQADFSPGGEDWGSEVTYWLWKDEPGMDDILKQAGDSLDKFFDRFKIYPVNIDGGRVLFLGRIEIRKYGEESQFSDKGTGTGLGFIDLLCGFPMECTEMMVMVGEISARAAYKAGKLPVQDGKGQPTSPMPDSFFEGYEDVRTLLTYMYLDTQYAMCWIDGLKGEPEPGGLKWWVRVPFPEQLDNKPAKFPYPGEFVAMGVRLMPDKPWWDQESSPFLFSGNWADTVYLSGAVIKEIQEPTDERPYPTYTVQWRKNEIKDVRPSDFAEYRVDDRVAVLKDIESDKKTETWKDDDTKGSEEKAFDKDKWVIVPLMFFGIDTEKED
jgi:hypothetical protein